MNQNLTSLPRFGSPSHASLETLQSRFALRVAARLTERSAEIAPDLNERLRFAREKALERAREVRRAQAPAVVGVTRGGAAIFAGNGGAWWLKAASILPVFALLAGLLLIQQAQDTRQIAVAAEVDAALLSDTVPPQAYGDPGFAEFLKTPAE